MFSPRSNFATVILDDMIFVIGGYNGTCTREVFDDEGDVVLFAPKDPRTFVTGHCVILEKRLFFFSASFRPLRARRNALSTRKCRKRFQKFYMEPVFNGEKGT